MGRSFFVSGFRDGDPRGGRDAWVDTEMQMREEGSRHPGADDLPMEEVPIIDPRTGQQAINPLTGRPRSRKVRKDSALGFDSGDFVHGDSRLVNINEEVEIQGGKPTGRILHRTAMVGADGRLQGTFVAPYEKTREGRFVKAAPYRRYFT